MRVSVTDAKAQLTDLVRRAEAGEDIELTRHGRPVVKLAPTSKPRLSREERLRILTEVMESARGKATPGPSAARAADFLYDDDGLPV